MKVNICVFNFGATRGVTVSMSACKPATKASVQVRVSLGA